MVPVVVIVADLTADLARGEFRAVHVHVGSSRAYQRNDLRELSRCRGRGTSDAVSGLVLNVGRRERARDSPVPIVQWVIRVACGRRGGRSGIGFGITQPEDDASLVLRMSDMDVRLPDVSFKVSERQQVVDLGFVVADERAERAGPSR